MGSTSLLPPARRQGSDSLCRQAHTAGRHLSDNCAQPAQPPSVGATDLIAAGGANHATYVKIVAVDSVTVSRFNVNAGFIEAFDIELTNSWHGP